MNKNKFQNIKRTKKKIIASIKSMENILYMYIGIYQININLIYPFWSMH